MVPTMADATTAAAMTRKTTRPLDRPLLPFLPLVSPLPATGVALRLAVWLREGVRLRVLAREGVRLGVPSSSEPVASSSFPGRGGGGGEGQAQAPLYTPCTRTF